MIASGGHWSIPRPFMRYFDRWLVACGIWALWVVGSKLYSFVGDVGFERASLRSDTLWALH